MYIVLMGSWCRIVWNQLEYGETMEEITRYHMICITRIFHELLECKAMDIDRISWSQWSVVE
jgi:hypothetical protein